MYWLLIGLIVMAMILLVWASSSRGNEGFTTIDLATATAQRQQLQFEGERRYNDLGRLQAPDTTLSPDLVDAAISQPLAKPSKNAASLLTLVGSSLGLGGGALAGRGRGVEQTGAVAEKIRFCESLPLDCSKLDDPRMAECGMCHRDGIDSKGKAHRGGMYIAADDIIRANEKAEGGRATYHPTIGTCKPQNFTLMRDNCEVREKQLTCQSAGAATAANQCGQCYGAAPGGATGLVFVGPKPRTFTAVLVLSHPGMHNLNGTGTIVTMPDGSTVNVAYSENPLLAPTTVYLNNIKEGDTIGIKVFGIPMVWCAWLTSPDGNRSVSINIGVQNEFANPGLVIAGDKRSAPVVKATNMYNSDIWASFQQQVPNTAMWYVRRDEIMNGGILSAYYGDANKNGLAVGPMLKALVGNSADILVNSATFGNDPSPGNPKNLSVQLDNGGAFNVADGATIPKSRLTNSANLSVIIPATLADPAFPDDKADCPTGPLVFTEVGAGLMGSHSCFKPDGTFNPSQFCLQELFTAAGGTQSGTDYPNTDAKAAALVVNGNLDDTTARLNNLGSIAQYGFDSNGVGADFATFKDASMRMLGRSPSNPCDGPNASTGPHTPECLDFLWRSAGASSIPSSDNAPGMYAYCSKGAPGAPLRADGSINEDNVTAANALGSVAAIRQAYSTLYKRTQNSADYKDQNAASQQCFGVSATPPPPKPFTCVPEVFSICPGGGYTLTSDEASAACEAAGARLATPQEIQDAQSRGANWCDCGWANDGTAYYPMNKILPEYGGGCGSVGVNSCGNMSWGGQASGKACATCYGVKPKRETNPPGILSFSTSTWNDPQIPQIGQFMSITSTAAPGTILRHSNFAMWVTAPDAMTAQGDATFKVVAANNGKNGYVSFQSVNFPDHYLRHSSFRGYLQAPDSSAAYKDDTSFVIVPALNGNATHFSIQSYNFPDHYLSVKPGTNEVWLLIPGSATDSASWKSVRPQNGSLNAV